MNTTGFVHVSGSARTTEAARRINRAEPVADSCDGSGEALDSQNSVLEGGEDGPVRMDKV
jgi:hypothetical protein